MQDFDELLRSFEAYLSDPDGYDIHASDIADLLRKLHHRNNERFFQALKDIPTDTLGDVLLELPEKIKDEAIDYLTPTELTLAVESL
ncbi:MAG: hypothetical protein OEW60_08595, partial [Thiovulaceae bacterium]|nr:hypothetical protein [Sulfurimonadaceae bacterium]